jgi:hypothetical protein
MLCPPHQNAEKTVNAAKEANDNMKYKNISWSVLRSLSFPDHQHQNTTTSRKIELIATIKQLRLKALLDKHFEAHSSGPTTFLYVDLSTRIPAPPFIPTSQHGSANHLRTNQSPSTESVLGLLPMFRHKWLSLK